MTDRAAALETQSVAAFAQDKSAGGARASAMAEGLVGSEILRIAAEIRVLAAAGQRICDLTVGDFSPKQFPIPERLQTAIVAALQAGETNYPPSTGMPLLRE